MTAMLWRWIAPLSVLAMAGLPAAHRSVPITLGILPFRDATASGNSAVGPAVGLTMHDQVAHATTIEARVLTVDPAMPIEELDRARAVAIGRQQKVDVVFVGTVLEARVGESTRSGWLPRIRGTALNVGVRSVTANVTLQGELYDVASGEQIASLRSTGKETNNKFSGTAWTSLGAWDLGSTQAFLNSPLGKALQSAIANMVEKVAAAPLPVPPASAAKRPAP